MSDAAADLVLVDALDRAVCTHAAWHRRDPERVARASKVLAKDLSKRIADSVLDRQARSRTRTELYNTILPVLIELCERHGRERVRLQIALAFSCVMALGGLVAAVWL